MRTISAALGADNPPPHLSGFEMLLDAAATAADALDRAFPDPTSDERHAVSIIVEELGIDILTEAPTPGQIDVALSLAARRRRLGWRRR